MKLTPNETKLTDAMSSALAGVDPVIAQALRPHLSQTLGKFEGCPLVCEFWNDKIWLGCGNNVIALTPEAFKTLSEVAIKCGWQCD